jgi:hypothetical protein
MDPPNQSVVAEKALIQQHYDQQAQPLGSPRSGGSGSNMVPGSPVELDDATADDAHRVPTPPPYSGPSSSAQEPAARPPPKGPQKYPGLPRLDYRLYSPPLFDLSADCTTIKTTAPYLSANATALSALVRAQSTVPPKPQIHITGKRGSKLDFAIKLNLLPLLVPEDPRQRMDYLRCVGDGEVAFRGGIKPSGEPGVGADGGLEDWVRRFVEDAGPVKIFVLERVVANMDVDWLEGQIRSMIASTQYKGVVTVTFPVTHAKVVVQNPDRVNKFFTTVTSIFSGKKRYEVVKAVWPFATAKSGEPGRRCLVQSEETWWKEWKDSIKYAIATKRQGWVTNEDKLEAIMEGVGKGLSTVDWGPEY